MSASLGKAAPRPRAAAPREYHFPRFTQHVLPNGVGVIVAPVAKLPLVTVLAVVEAGASTDPDGKEGIASLTARLLLEGTRDLDANALSDRFERIGAAIEVHADWDVTVASLTALRGRLPEAFSLLRDILRDPAFPEREVSRLKGERLADLLQQQAEPRTLADDRFYEAVYDGSSRYARPEAGSTTTVRALTREDVLAFHSARYVPTGVTLVVAGDVSEQDALSLAAERFSDWTGTAPSPVARIVDAGRAGKLVRVVGKSDAPQSEVRVGHRGLKRNIPDYFATTVMNAVLGGLFSSRINMNLREAHGYTYGANSLFEWRRHAGPFMVSTAVKSEVTGAAVREILNEIVRMRAGQIDDGELTLATHYLDGVFPIRYETTSAIATALANMHIFGLPKDYYDTYREHVRGVTTAGVLQAAKSHLRADDLCIVVVGDPAVIVDQLAEVTGAAVDVTRADDGGTSL